MKQPLTARSSTRLSGRVRVPGDKSISHRALILGALATGTTRITGLLEAEDVAATANALSRARRRGRAFERQGHGEGQGIGGLRAPSSPLDFGNSGTATRLMLGVIAGHDMQVELHGRCLVAAAAHGPGARRRLPPWACKTGAEAGSRDAPSRRPRHLGPLPHRLRPSRAVGAGEVGRASRRPSCAGPHHGGRALGRRATTPSACWDFSAPRSSAKDRGEGARAVTVCGDAELHGASIAVPGDPSSAAFLIAAALICARLRHRRRGRAAQSDAKRLHRNVARDGREHRDPRPPRRRRRACRRSSRAVERAESRSRHPRAGAVDDRRISDPRLSCRLRRGRNARWRGLPS